MAGFTQMVLGGRTMFDIDQFVADCREALAADRSHKLVREVVKRAVAERTVMLKTLGEPKRAELQTLYRANDLTVLNLIWGPNMVLLPHDHRMWAVIGIYSGREDNIFWRRKNGQNGKLEAVAAKALGERDAEPLALGAQHHPFRDQSDSKTNRCYPHLWRRFLRDRTQRMGSWDPIRATI